MAEQKQQSNRSMPAPSGAVSEEVKLSTPDHSEEMKEEHASHSIEKVGNSDTDVKVKEPSTGAIEVRATRDGFIYNLRKTKGDRFKIPSFDLLGEWMECIDPEMEKKAKAHRMKLKQARS